MRPLSQIFKPSVGKRAPSKRKGQRGRSRRGTLRRRQSLTFLFFIALIAGLGAGTWHLWRNGIVQQVYSETLSEVSLWTDRQVVRAGLTVQHVFVTGRGETSKNQVLGAVGVRSGQSILAFDPTGARHRLLKLGWVETARVERRLPDTIVVHLTERQALALWQHKGRQVLIDRSGKPITRKGLGRFAHLPVVVGKDAPQKAAGLIDMLSQQPALYTQVQAAVRVGARRWDLRLKNGVKVQLPETQPLDAWTRLAELVAEHSIFEREIAAIDLRLPDRLVLRLTKEAAARKNKNGKDT